MPAGEQLPGTETASAERIVLHVDNDCFYAACERLREPALAGEPLVIGMGYDETESTGAVATASYEAREYEIESAQPISEAVERLPPRAGSEGDIEPSAHYRPVDMEFYKSVATDVKAILREYGDTVREVSIDEAYLDCTERTTWSAAADYGRRIKEEIQDDVGIPSSIGIAPNMAVAKIASDHDKPDGLVVVPPDEVAEFLDPLPIDALHGVGPVTADKLKSAGLATAGDVASADPSHLVDRFGKRGRELHRRAQGIDERPVTPRGDPKSLSRESSFDEATATWDAVRDRVMELAAAVADRATQRGATYRTIGIKVVTPPYDVNTRERSLPGPVDEPDLVHDVALDLLEEFREVPVRKVGVRVSNLSFAAGEQPPLSTWEPTDDLQDGRESTVLDRTGQTTLRAFVGDDGSVGDVN